MRARASAGQLANASRNFQWNTPETVRFSSSYNWSHSLVLHLREPPTTECDRLLRFLFIYSLGQYTFFYLFFLLRTDVLKFNAFE